MPIFKSPNSNDTCIAEIAPDGWTEISQQQLESILTSRIDTQAVIKSKLAPVRRMRTETINSLNGIADRLERKGTVGIRAIADDVVQALLDITKNLPTDPALVDAELVTRYAAIVAPLQVTGSQLLSAFAELDQ